MSSLGNLWLFRHGETEWSRSGQHTSRTDLPLTAEGEQRAARLKPLLASLLGPKPFALVLTSPLRRAIETCRIAGLGEHAQITDNLREWDYGSYEGLTSEQIHETNPGWTIWNGTPPGGESADQIGARADRAIAQAVAADGDVALFGHGHMLRVLAARWLGLDPRDGRFFALSTGSISVLGYERGARVIQSWNRAA